MTELVFQNKTHALYNDETASSRKGKHLLDQRMTAHTAQRMSFSSGAFAHEKTTAQLMDNRQARIAQRNNTGLPDKLKSGVESLSGMSMDHVKVHYNSPKPSQLNAHAYAQGSDIHVAPGQEQHLPHEAWHVVQQAQGRVRPTLQMKTGVAVSDDKGLEAEADVMGARALGQGAQLSLGHIGRHYNLGQPLQLVRAYTQGQSTMQMATAVNYTSQSVKYSASPAHHAVKTAIVGKKMTATLDPADPIKGSEPGISGDSNLLYNTLNSASPTGWGAGHFVRGHLLNANLGGLGVAENLFPITPDLNHAHLEQIETPVKSLLLNDNVVEYAVETKQKNAGTDFRLNPNSSLECAVSVGGNVLINRIYSSTVNVGNQSLNEEIEGKGFGAHGSGYAPSFNDWLTAGIGANYVDKTTNKIIAKTDRQIIV